MKYLVTSVVEDVDMGSQEAEVTSSYDPLLVVGLYQFPYGSLNLVLDFKSWECRDKSYYLAMHY